MSETGAELALSLVKRWNELPKEADDQAKNEIKRALSNLLDYLKIGQDGSEAITILSRNFPDRGNLLKFGIQEKDRLLAGITARYYLTAKVIDEQTKRALFEGLTGLFLSELRVGGSNEIELDMRDQRGIECLI